MPTPAHVISSRALSRDPSSAAAQPSRQSVEEEAIPLHSLFLSSPDAIVVCDCEGRILTVNDQLCAIFGYQPEQLVGMPIESLLPSRFREAHSGQRARYLVDPAVRPMGQSREVFGLRSDGREIELEIRLRMISGPQMTMIVASVRDVSELRMLQAIQRNSNLALERIATGQPLAEILQTLVDNIETATPNLRCSVLRTDVQHAKLYTILTRRLPAAVHRAIDGSPIGEGGGACGMAALLNQPVVIADTKNHPLFIPFRKLARLHQLRACWSTPIRGSRGNVLGTLAVYYPEPHEPTSREIESVTAACNLAGIAIERDLRAEQLREKEEQLRHAQKIEAVGTLSGGIAHEFNNLLQVIHGYTNCTLNSLASDDPRRQDLDQVQSAAQRAKSLTRQLLNFSRRQPSHTTVIDLNETIQQMVAMLQPILGSRIDLRMVLDTNTQPVLADDGQVRQALMNLCLNARDAMPEGGVIRIASQTVRLDDFRVAKLRGISPGPATVISVSDTGTGMASEVLARIFDPFFTTKGVGKGTGLGLSVVFGIMQQHGGAIDVESEPGHGATFRLYFPHGRPPAEPPSARSSSSH